MGKKRSPRNVISHFNVVDCIVYILNSEFKIRDSFFFWLLLFDRLALTLFGYNSKHQIDAIPFHMFSYFHFALRFVFLAWPFFLSLSLAYIYVHTVPLNHNFFFSGISRSRDRPTDRSYTLFFLFILIFCYVCAMVILMSVFIYSWFSCLCDKDGSNTNNNSNRLVFLWVIHFSAIFS